MADAPKTVAMHRLRPVAWGDWTIAQQKSADVVVYILRHPPFYSRIVCAS